MAAVRVKVTQKQRYRWHTLSKSIDVCLSPNLYEIKCIAGHCLIGLLALWYVSLSGGGVFVWQYNTRTVVQN